LLDAETLRALERLTLASLDAVVTGVAGQRARAMLGSGHEFEDYRHYAPGDDLRRLDWHAYLRLGELLVRVGPEEGYVELDLLIDTSRSMGADPSGPSKLRYAKQVAAALGAIALLRADAVRAWALSDGGAAPDARFDTPEQLGLLEHALSRLDAGRVTDLPASVRSYRSAGATADLAVLISDALISAPSLAQALGELSTGAGATAFVHVLDRSDAAPAQRGPLVLRDRETGRRFELSLTPAVAAAYERRFERFRSAVREACERAGVRYIAAPTDEPVLELLSGSARLAGLVGV
jgi:uncharacterized protein (DUF58 family)